MAENNNIAVGGRLHSIATGNVLAGANEIFDDDKNKKQSQINTETDQMLAAHGSAINGLEGQNYVTLVATDADADIAAVFTRLSITPATDTVYRIANWKHDATPKYNINYYSEYAATGTTTANLVPISVENKGIDDTPVRDSDNFVKSDGIKRAIDAVVDDNIKYGGEYQFMTADYWLVGAKVVSGEIVTDSDSNSFIKVKQISKGDIINIHAEQSGSASNSNIVLAYSSTKPSIGTTGIREIENRTIGVSNSIVNINWIADADGWIVVRSYLRNTITFSMWRKRNYKDILTLYSANSNVNLSTGKVIIADSEDDNFGNTKTVATSYGVTDYIDVQSAKYIKVNTRVVSSAAWARDNIAGCVFYNENKQPIAGFAIMEGNFNGVSTGDYSVYLVPISAAYARLTLSPAYTDVSVFKDYNAESEDDNLDLKIDAVDARIGKERIVLTSVDDFEYARRHIVDTSTESDTGTRYTLGIDVIAGDKIDIQSSLSPGIVVGVFATFDKGCKGSSDSILQNFSSSYTTNELSGTIKVNGVLIVKFKKSDNSAITDADIATMRASLDVTIIKTSTGVIGRCDVLDEDIEYLLNTKEYNQYDMYAGVYRSYSASATNQRIRYYRKLEGKFKVAFDVPQGLEAAIGCCQTDAKAFSGDIYLTVLDYQSGRVDTNGYVDIPEEAPYVFIAFKYAETTVYNEDAVFDLVNSSIAFTLYNKTKAEETEDGKNVFPLLFPVQYSINQYGLNEESKVRVSGHDVIAVPASKCSIKFVDKSEHIFLGVRSGYVGSSVGNNRYWFTNGYVLPFGDTDLYFMYSLGISRNSLYSPIPLAVIERLIERGELYFEVITDDNTNVIERNADNEKFAKAMMMNFTTYLGLNTYPTIGHTSDIHGDYTRAKNFFEYCKFLGIDYCVSTGDHVAYTRTNGCKYLEKASESFDKTVLVTTGNHDSYHNTEGDSGLYDRNIKFYAEKFSYVANEKPYYYLDDTDKKIRFIAMNLYDGTVPTNGTYYMISSAQINWLINTLTSTPQDYAVFLMYHAPEINVVSINDAANFYQSSRPYWDTQANDITGSPITKIVNAFIAGTKGDADNAIIGGSFSFNDAGGTPVTVSYEADFTSVNTGVEFIAHLCGHEHLDSVGYYTGYDGSTQGKYKQLVLNVTCGTGVYGTSSYRYLANNSDLPRGTKGATQDSFNVYVLRRDIKSVAVARIGSHYTYDGMDRDKCVIAYSD